MARTYGRNEGVVLLGGNACKGLKPVGVVSRSLFYCPILHSVCYYVRNGGINGLTCSDGFCQGFVDLLGKSFSHDIIVKDHAAENFRNFFSHYFYLINKAYLSDLILYYITYFQDCQHTSFKKNIRRDFLVQISHNFRGRYVFWFVWTVIYIRRADSNKATDRPQNLYKPVERYSPCTSAPYSSKYLSIILPTV